MMFRFLIVNVRSWLHRLTSFSNRRARTNARFRRRSQSFFQHCTLGSTTACPPRYLTPVAARHAPRNTSCECLVRAATLAGTLRPTIRIWMLVRILRAPPRVRRKTPCPGRGGNSTTFQRSSLGESARVWSPRPKPGLQSEIWRSSLRGLRFRFPAPGCRRHGDGFARWWRRVRQRWWYGASPADMVAGTRRMCRCEG